MIDMTLPQGLPGADERRRGRSLRRRYTIVRWLVSALGALLASGCIGWLIVRMPDRQLLWETSFVVPAALLVLAAAGVPWLVIGALRRRALRRHRHEWGGEGLF